MTSVVLHFLAGLASGTIFAVRTLLLLVGVAVLECVGLLILRGLDAALIGVAGLAVLQIGYLLGIAVRGVMEMWGLATPVVRTRHSS